MRSLWIDWSPRVADYWASFSAPYRKEITDLVDKATPPGGSVMDFGCGVGVQAFLLRQRRPDILIYAVDCNPQARNLTQMLMGTDPRLMIEDTPLSDAAVRPVDTIVSVFACAYLLPQEIGTILTAFRAKSPTLILAEPTELEDQIQAYAGMPTACYAYPYGYWFRGWGDEVEQVPVEAGDMLNAITVGRRPILSSPEEYP